MECDVICSENENEPTLILNVKEKNGRSLLFTILKEDFENIKAFLDNLVDSADIHMVIKYLRSQGFKETIKEIK